MRRRAGNKSGPCRLSKLSTASNLLQYKYSKLDVFRRMSGCREHSLRIHLRRNMLTNGPTKTRWQDNGCARTCSIQVDLYLHRAEQPAPELNFRQKYVWVPWFSTLRDGFSSSPGVHVNFVETFWSLSACSMRVAPGI